MVGGTIPELGYWNNLTLENKIDLIKSVGTIEDLKKIEEYNERMRDVESYKKDQLTDVSIALLNKVKESFPQHIKSTGEVTKKVECSCTKKVKK